MTGVNNNPILYGPGPVRRLGRGFATGPPLMGLAKCAAQATVIGFVAAIAYKVTIKDPTERVVADYYKKNP
eukprot:CAMPEP_0172494684 /NCGR_PEP_ID=MMETSP1066-20121228/53859_1 /TAXON_ID=671091 /ORGANISM="Coscinodiscus wailesii, Strain CCMP2513" /LENGTH=70 /DNA_ID=CAMNT_0013265855 /DNA_START=132 /DNA_END=344 /DNA_ORIENTATION=+